MEDGDNLLVALYGLTIPRKEMGGPILSPQAHIINYDTAYVFRKGRAALLTTQTRNPLFAVKTTALAITSWIKHCLSTQLVTTCLLFLLRSL